MVSEHEDEVDGYMEVVLTVLEWAVSLRLIPICQVAKPHRGSDKITPCHLLHSLGLSFLNHSCKPLDILSLKPGLGVWDVDEGSITLFKFMIIFIGQVRC